mmetsp:Transcript_25006/g.73175  ORF Transcript_25006/g.73175 Transcript_25006/m.73175 type:complete len:294 (-) Transcript_25006:707-1588(-)
MSVPPARQRGIVGGIVIILVVGQGGFEGIVVSAGGGGGGAGPVLADGVAGVVRAGLVFVVLEGIFDGVSHGQDGGIDEGPDHIPFVFGNANAGTTLPSFPEPFLLLHPPFLLLLHPQPFQPQHVPPEERRALPPPFGKQRTSLLGPSERNLPGTLDLLQEIETELDGTAEYPPLRIRFDEAVIAKDVGSTINVDPTAAIGALIVRAVNLFSLRNISAGVYLEIGIVRMFDLFVHQAQIFSVPVVVKVIEGQNQIILGPLRHQHRRVLLERIVRSSASAPPIVLQQIGRSPRRQ